MRAVFASARYWLPLVAALACLVAALYVGSILTLILMIVAFGLVIEVSTAMWARAGGTGDLSRNRQ